ncbi:plasmid mobilization protein [Pontibacter rugosus]|uniref:Mobilization protein MobC n=1 Tax=Pontibacter rugosus TaxID=1745966 RepID=A0ABW3SJN1_9BACT
MEKGTKAQEWKPRGGRPKVRAEDRRENLLKVRLTNKERSDLEAKAGAAGYTDLSAYIRLRLFSEQGAGHNPKELFHAIDKTGAALKKVGTNLNQVVRYLHYLEKNNMVSEQTIAEYNQHFRMLIEVEEEYVKAIRAFLRTTR